MHGSKAWSRPPAAAATSRDPARRARALRREAGAWIEGAKREETRRRRIARAVELLRDGVRTPDG